MKKVKIMLMAIAVIAVTGAALAFKATQKFQETFCTTENPLLAECRLLDCPDAIELTSQVNDDILINICTIPAGQFECLQSPVGPVLKCLDEPVTTSFLEQ